MSMCETNSLNSAPNTGFPDKSVRLDAANCLVFLENPIAGRPLAQSNGLVLLCADIVCCAFV